MVSLSAEFEACSGQVRMEGHSFILVQKGRSHREAVDSSIRQSYHAVGRQPGHKADNKSSASCLVSS